MSKAALALAVLLVLGGCESLFGKEEKPFCPRITVVRDADSVTQFRAGPGRDVSDVEFHAEFGEIRAGCELKAGVVSIRMMLPIVAERGAAAQSRTGSFPFFVAITDPKNEILNKVVFDSPIEFKPNQQRSGVSEEVDQSIRLKAGTLAEEYEILIGFQVSAEQLEFNRRQRGR